MNGKPLSYWILVFFIAIYFISFLPLPQLIAKLCKFKFLNDFPFFFSCSNRNPSHSDHLLKSFHQPSYSLYKVEGPVWDVNQITSIFVKTIDWEFIAAEFTKIPMLSHAWHCCFFFLFVFCFFLIWQPMALGKYIILWVG